MEEKKLALWGYGSYGRSLEKIFARKPDGEYRITAVFDQRFQALTQEGITARNGSLVQDPAQIAAMFQQGLFDAVLLAIYDSTQKKKASSLLRDMGIPIWDTRDMTPMQPASYFKTFEAPLRLSQEGYVQYCFQDQYLEILNTWPFVFDGEGTLNGAYWHRYQRRFDYITQLYCADLSGPVEELPGEWCLLSGVFGKNYWHFTFELLDRFVVLEENGYRGNYLLWHTDFAEELLQLAGADLSRVKWLDDLRPDTVYHFEKLVLAALPDDSYAYAAPVLLRAAETIKQNLPPITHDYPEMVYVQRIGTRKLIIDPDILASYGFHTIIPDQLPVAEQIRYFRHAKIVLSPHGANSTNSLYMEPGSVMIETFPNSYINPCCLTTLELQKDVYYLQVTQRLEPTMKAGADQYADYSVSARLLDLAVRAAKKLAGID